MPFLGRQLRRVLLLTLALLIPACAGCQTAYYATMEKIGVPKRNILVDRVESARDAQVEAKEQFASALEEFSAVLGFHGGSLQDKYDQLNRQLERSQARADEVSSRIDAVEHVSGALFREWEQELGQYTSAELRRSSDQKLQETRRRYDELMAAMHRAESRMEPVLKPLRDNVLFLKHNLNAQAVASLQTELGNVEGDVDALVREMEAAIREADAFITAMGQV